MSNFMDDYFGPLSREYCGYFYILSVMFGFLFVFSILSIVYTFVVHYKKINTMFVANSFALLINIFLEQEGRAKRYEALVHVLFLGKAMCSNPEATREYWVILSLFWNRNRVEPRQYQQKIM